MKTNRISATDVTSEKAALADGKTNTWLEKQERGKITLDVPQPRNSNKWKAKQLLKQYQEVGNY